MELKLIGIDMDDTLLRENKTYDEERFKKVYKELKEQGITTVIASGNSYPRLDEYFSHMNHEDLYFAGDNGNYIVKKEEVLHKAVVDYPEIWEVAKKLSEMDNISSIYCDGVHSYSTGINKEYEDYILSYYGNLQIVDSLDEIKMDEIVKIANHSPASLKEIKENAEKITEKFTSFDAVSSGGGWFDIFDVNGGKGSAIQALQEKYNVKPEETMVFGDSQNDASMVEHAKYSVALSNADDKLKEISNYEIGSNEEQAVLDILEKISETDSLDFMDEFQK